MVSKKLKKTLALTMVTVMALGACMGCKKKTSGFDENHEITVVTREEGSGTRGAFIELFGVEEKDADGNKTDKTVSTAIQTNNTSVMMTTVSGDVHSIGYSSLGSLNDTVKAVKIDGVEATVENIKSGKYKISRPFNIVTKSKVSEAAQDFIDYIMSADGQAVIEANGYIKLSDAPAYNGSKPSGKIVVSGSSSVTPVMEKLKESYEKVNPNAAVTIQESDSSTGVKDTIQGACDIGMASRELKDTETKEGVSSKTIAMDGIAVIVNKGNDVDNLTSEQVKKIFTGESSVWKDVK